jgi:hypothetical protein
MGRFWTELFERYQRSERRDKAVPGKFAVDSPLEETVTSEPVSENGFQAPAEKVPFRGLLDHDGRGKGGILGVYRPESGF